MPNITVVDSLIQITSNDDIASLERSLVETMHQLYLQIDFQLFSCKRQAITPSFF